MIPSSLERQMRAALSSLTHRFISQSRAMANKVARMQMRRINGSIGDTSRD
jgi:hypothetical protein